MNKGHKKLISVFEKKFFSPIIAENKSLLSSAGRATDL